MGQRRHFCTAEQVFDAHIAHIGQAQPPAHQLYQIGNDPDPYGVG